MKWIKLFESFNSDMLELAKDAMVDLMDDGFLIVNKRTHNNRCIMISKQLFYWDNVKDSIIKFLELNDRITGVEIKYYIEVSDTLWENDRIQLTAKEVLNGKVEEISNKILGIVSRANIELHKGQELNMQSFYLYEIKIFY